MTEKLSPGPCSLWEGPGKVKSLGLEGPVGPARAVCGSLGGGEKPFSSLSLWVEIEGISRNVFPITQTWAQQVCLLQSFRMLLALPLATVMNWGFPREGGSLFPCHPAIQPPGYSPWLWNPGGTRPIGYRCPPYSGWVWPTEGPSRGQRPASRSPLAQRSASRQGWSSDLLSQSTTPPLGRLSASTSHLPAWGLVCSSHQAPEHQTHIRAKCPTCCGWPGTD